MDFQQTCFKTNNFSNICDKKKYFKQSLKKIRKFAQAFNPRRVTRHVGGPY